jgi:myo-inositol 2-dehydrogenase / D-chiro-inositol 1-dehydrogenase
VALANECFVNECYNFLPTTEQENIMSESTDNSSDESTSRRQFIKTTASAAVAGGTGATLASSLSVHAAGSDMLRVGLVGCGGRGSGAARQALMADENVKLTVMADAFENRLTGSLKSLSAVEELSGKIDVPLDRQFVGFDAYKHVLASDVDVVLLTTPPHFRPLHLKAAVAAGKHVFAEKPVAVDAPGVRSVMESCAEAKRRRLSVVSGLCLRYDNGFRETVKRLHDGAIGDIHTLMANDYRGSIWVKPRKPEWTDMHWQMRNWYYFTWLSGDFNVEQHVHYLDVCAWIMNGYPIKAIGMGGRQVRTDDMYGNIYDHHSVTYEYENGARLFSNCRQQSGCKNSMTAKVAGSKGVAEVSERRLEITTDATWQFQDKVKNMYQVEHDELFAGIRAGRPLNNGEYMARSTLLAIMGRMATYTGQEVTWDEAMNSKQDLSPEQYGWGPAPKVEIAIPGITRLV